MKVLIKDTQTEKMLEAEIVPLNNKQLPSMQEGWHFNFSKQVQKLQQTLCFGLKVRGSDKLEGCMVFQLLAQRIASEPAECRMPFLEVAPHNYNGGKKYEGVAGCLLAYAYYLSAEKGEEYNKGILFFEVGEKNPLHEAKLIELYQQKYKAKRWKTTTLLLLDKVAGAHLLNTYLNI